MENINLTGFRKTVETGVDPRHGSSVFSSNPSLNTATDQTTNYVIFVSHKFSTVV